ncbi:hypothetical protein ASZ78_015029, partial [Callipepla squamata]
MEPSGDVAVLTEDLRYPAPTVGCASAQTAPLTCTATTVGADEVMTSSDVTGDTVDVEDLLTWINAAMTSSDVTGDVVDVEDLLTWINDVASAVEVPQENQDGSKVQEEHLKSDRLEDELPGELDSQEREELMAWIDATEPRSPDVPSSPAPPCFISELPDFPQHSRDLNEEARAATGTPTDPFWGLPPSPGQLSELLQCEPLLLPAVAPPELSLPTRLAVPAPPSPCTAQLMGEARRRQPRVVVTRLAL